MALKLAEVSSPLFLCGHTSQNTDAPAPKEEESNGQNLSSYHILVSLQSLVTGKYSENNDFIFLYLFFVQIKNTKARNGLNYKFFQWAVQW